MNKKSMLSILLIGIALSVVVAVSALQIAIKVLAVLLILALALLSIFIKSLVFFLNGVVNHTKQRRKAIFDVLTIPATDIVMLGDSITHEGLWEEYFPHYNLRNRGIGGDTTQDILDRLPAIYALQPQRLFLLIGINDINMGIKPVQTFANYEQILISLRQHLPAIKIYVQSILPVAAAWPMANNTAVKKYNVQVERLAVQHGCTYIDLYKSFSDTQGNLKAELSNDGIHLTYAGYVSWCDVIRPFVTA
jgi:lysophospholipase L1-like esterase